APRRPSTKETHSTRTSSCRITSLPFPALTRSIPGRGHRGLARATPTPPSLMATWAVPSTTSRRKRLSTEEDQGHRQDRDDYAACYASYPIGTCQLKACDAPMHDGFHVVGPRIGLDWSIHDGNVIR